MVWIQIHIDFGRVKAWVVDKTLAVDILYFVEVVLESPLLQVEVCLGVVDVSADLAGALKEIRLD